MQLRGAGASRPRPTDRAVAQVIAWYGQNLRDLPWRGADRSPWEVLVSEVMLQQTPVDRVEPTWREWMLRWPQPADLAVAPPADVIRAWGRLGYPRRALWLRSAAVDIVEVHNGEVPEDLDQLRQLPGIGEYTAAAVAVFAFGGRHAVLDTNVRRVHARWLDGKEFPGASSITAAERARACDILPESAPEAATWSVAVMELGSLVCSARKAPQCHRCPLQPECLWAAQGYPAAERRPRVQARFAGSDRQARGAIMALLRESATAVDPAELASAWAPQAQRQRAVQSLIRDGLLQKCRDGYRLPGSAPSDEGRPPHSY